MPNLQLLSPDLASTVQIGRVLGQCLDRGSFVALDGILGAGKTHFVKGIAQGLDEGGWAGLRSPTFTLMLSYHGGRCPLHHIDFYRLNESPELPGEILEAMHTESDITVVEWASIWRELWPSHYIHVHIDVQEDGKRRISIEDQQRQCPKLEKALDAWAIEPAQA